MVETARHAEAFEYYYNGGNRRPDHEIAQKFTVSRQSIVKWKREFNWKERARQRDIEVARKFEKEVVKEIVNEKADWLRDIRIAAGYPKKMLSNTKEELESGNLKIKSALELDKAVAAMERLFKMHMALIGESGESIEHKIVIQMPPGVDTEKIC